MKFGLFYLFSDFGQITQDRLFHKVLEEITYAEELGFEAVWLPEHHFAVYGMLGNPMIFAVACVKAVLVAANFMHLRFEPALIYALVLIPLLFLVVLAAALLPDFVWHSVAR